MLEGSLRRALEGIISRNGDVNEVAELAAKCQMRGGMDPDEWKDALGALARIGSESFVWLTAGEGIMLRFSAGRQVVIALTDCWPYQHDAIEEDELKELIGDYVHWVAAQSNEQVCAFCWALLRAQPRRQGSVAQLPIYWLMRQGRLRGDIELSSLELAVALADEETAMFWWPDERWRVTHWQGASEAYKLFLDHGSSLVRAAASKALGRLHKGLRDRMDTPALNDMLQEMAQREAKFAGVAGPFLEGTDWGIDDWSDILESFDMRAWFLDTLRNSGREPDWPEAQALEFYAQEYLNADGAAIEELIEMGREELALMTATSVPENLELLRPVLEEMARSENPRIAQAVQAYLAEHGQATGRQWLN